MDSDNTNIALIIVGLFLFLIIVSLLGFLLTKVTPKQDVNEENQELPNFIDLKIRSDYPYKELNYTVFRQGLVIEKGVVKKNIVERIKNLENTTNYTVLVDNEEFYKEEQVCNARQPDCYIKIDKIGKLQIHLLEIKEDFYRVILYVEEGILKNPRICIAENSENIKFMKLANENNDEFYEIEIPFKYKIYYDKCYKLMTKEQMKKIILRDLREKYNIDIKVYNEEHKTRYKDFDEIPISDKEYNDYPVDPLREGFHEYNLLFELENKGYKDNDIIKVMVLADETLPIEKHLNIT